jgi:hypothetical protein
MAWNTGDKIVLRFDGMYKKLEPLQIAMGGYLTIRRKKHCRRICRFADKRPFFCSQNAYRVEGDEKLLRKTSHWCHLEEHGERKYFMIPKPKRFKYDKRRSN